MRLVGDYRYGGCTIDGIRYAVVKNYDIVERILVSHPHENADLIWQAGDPIDENILNIMTKADFTPPPLPDWAVSQTDGEF